MDTCTSWTSYVTVLVYSICLLAGQVCRGQQPLDLASLPRFLLTNSNFTFKVGQVAVLECAVENLEDKMVVWRLASDSIPISVGHMTFSEDARYSVQHRAGSNYWNLVITDVQLADSGVYECQISSRVRHLRHHVTLLVTEDNPSVPTFKPNIEISGSRYVDEGDHIYLVCNATSQEYPPEDIDWFRDGNTLNTDESRGYQIHKYVSISTATIVSTLEIKHARLSDQGVYVCRTSNKDVTSTFVNVLNGDTFNVKRGTPKKDDVSDEEAAILGLASQTHGGSRCTAPSWLIIVLALCRLSWCVLLQEVT